MTEKLAIPGDGGWVSLSVPELDTITYDRNHISIPAHIIEVALRYPRYADGSLAAGMTQREVAELMAGYVEQGIKGGLALYEDQFLRDILGKDHPMFHENFESHGQAWHLGYVLDYNKRCSERSVDGLRQKLVTRRIGYRLPSGDVELGVTTIAPSGMVPLLTKAQIEKHFGKDSLSRLEKLGVAIPENGEETVKPWSALGYPQLSLYHDYRENGEPVPHSHHIYTPLQNDAERVGVRSADWHHRGEVGCFCVYLDYEPVYLYSNRSVPLVRGGEYEMEVERKIDF